MWWRAFRACARLRHRDGPRMGGGRDCRRYRNAELSGRQGREPATPRRGAGGPGVADGAPGPELHELYGSGTREAADDGIPALRRQEPVRRVCRGTARRADHGDAGGQRRRPGPRRLGDDRHRPERERRSHVRVHRHAARRSLRDVERIVALPAALGSRRDASPVHANKAGGSTSRAGSPRRATSTRGRTIPRRTRTAATTASRPRRTATPRVGRS